MSTYIVKPGETLSGIGQQFGIDWRKITGFRSGDPNLIYPGEVLTIPGAEKKFSTLADRPIEGFTPYVAPTPAQTTIRADDLTTSIAPVVEPTLEDIDIPTITPLPAITPPTEPPTPPAEERPDYLKSYIESLEPQSYIESLEPPKQPDLQKAREEAGLPEREEAFTESQRAVKAAQSEFDIINAQIADIVGQTQQRKLEIAEEPISAGAIRGRNIVEERRLAIRAIPLQAQALMAQARIASLQGDEIIAQNALIMAQDSLDKVFGMQLDYQENLRTFNNDLRAMVYDEATAEQKRLLDAQEKEDDRNFDLMRDAIDNAQSVANGLLKTQPSLAAQISQIDWSQPDAVSKFVELQAQITPDPMTSLNIAVKQAQLTKLQRETELLGEPSAAEKKKIAEDLKSAQASIPIMQDKIDAVDALLESPGLNSRVGTSVLTRKPIGIWGALGKIASVAGLATLPGDILDKITGQGQAFAGGVHKLISGLSLQALIDAKSRGATFGALSDAEMRILSSSASAIADWEILDKNGNPTGVWNIDEESFKRELKTIQDLTKRALFLQQGTLIDSEEQSLLDDIYNNVGGQDPSAFFE